MNAARRRKGAAPEQAAPAMSLLPDAAPSGEAREPAGAGRRRRRRGRRGRGGRADGAEPTAPAKAGPKGKPAAPAKAGPKGKPAVPAKAGPKGKPAVPAKAGPKGKPAVPAKAGPRGRSARPPKQVPPASSLPEPGIPSRSSPHPQPSGRAQPSRAALEAYCLSRSHGESEALRALAGETRAKTKASEMMVGPMEGGLLRVLARLVKAKRVLELGCFTGYSALAMAEALPPGGRLVTLEKDPKRAAMAKRLWKASPHGRKIQQMVGPALESLPKVWGRFDMVFLDADKENYAAYWEACLPKVKKGGLLVADNTLWGGGVLVPCDAESKALADFNRRVHADSRVEAVLLPLRDGITLAWRR